jgi:hypothetical protein
MESLHTCLVKLRRSVIVLHAPQRRLPQGKSTLILTHGPSSSYLEVTSTNYTKLGIISVCIVKYVTYKMTPHNLTCNTTTLRTLNTSGCLLWLWKFPFSFKA